MTLVVADTVPPRDRAAFLGDAASRLVMDVDVTPANEGPIHGGIRGEMIGDLPVAEAHGVNLQVLRTRPGVARSPLPFYFACLQVVGAARFLWRQQETRLSPGDFYVVDTRHEFALDLRSPHRHLAIRVPREWLHARVARPDLIAGTVLRQDQPLTRLLASYLRDGVEHAGQLSGAGASLFAQHSVDLLVQALGESRSSAPTPSQAIRSALLVRANRLIRLRYAEADLAPDSISRALGVSLRLLQRLFAEHGETVMGRVWQERIDGATRLLAAPQAAHRSITEIAFASGFNDSAHFTRAFAARMGMSPSHWRKQNLGARAGSQR